MTKKAQLFLYIALSFSQARGQTVPADAHAKPPQAHTAPSNAKDTASEQEEVYTSVDEPAEFPGGWRSMKEFIARNVKLPPQISNRSVTGKVFLQFIVSANGHIYDVEVLRGMPDCAACDHEAIRLLKLMPAWTPALVSGKAVKSYYTLPVLFTSVMTH